MAEQVCRPDVTGWRRERVPERPRGSPVRIVPDWTCEILSSSNKRIDLIRKKRLYHAHRVAHYWIVDPDAHTLERLVLRDGRFVIADALAEDAVFRPERFPGLEIPLAELWTLPGEGGATPPRDRGESEGTR